MPTSATTAVRRSPAALHSVQRSAAGRQPLRRCFSRHSMPARHAALLPSLVLRPAAGVCKGAGPQLRHAARAAPAAQAAGAGRLLRAHHQQGAAAACSQPVAAACGQAQVGSQPGQHSWRLQQLWGTTLAAAAAAAAAHETAAAAGVHAVHAVQGAAHQQGVAALPPLLQGREAQQLCIAQLQPAYEGAMGSLGLGSTITTGALSCTKPRLLHTPQRQERSDGPPRIRCTSRAGTSGTASIYFLTAAPQTHAAPAPGWRATASAGPAAAALPPR